MVILWEGVQSVNALPPIDVTPGGMVMPARPTQPKKALCPIEVTLLGMVTLVRLRQKLKT
jgi:hypothetical protein